MVVVTLLWIQYRSNGRDNCGDESHNSDPSRNDLTDGQGSDYGSRNGRDQLKQFVPKLLPLRQNMVCFGRIGRVLLDAKALIAMDCVGHGANLMAASVNCKRIPSRLF